MVTWFPLSKTMDTLQTVDKLSETLLPYARLKAEARRYVVGERPPHYSVPAINDAWLADPIWEHWIADAK